MGPRVSHIKYLNLYAASAKCGQTARIESVDSLCRDETDAPIT